jgi:hypothetical protein
LVHTEFISGLDSVKAREVLVKAKAGKSLPDTGPYTNPRANLTKFWRLLENLDTDVRVPPQTD